MMRHITAAGAALATLLAFGVLSTTNAAEETVKASSAWVGEGRLFKTGEKEALFIGAFVGKLYVESMEGALDAVDLACPGTQSRSTSPAGPTAARASVS